MDYSDTYEWNVWYTIFHKKVPSYVKYEYISSKHVLHFKANDIELLFDNIVPSDIKYK